MKNITKASMAARVASAALLVALVASCSSGAAEGESEATQWPTGGQTEDVESEATDVPIAGQDSPVDAQGSLPGGLPEDAAGPTEAEEPAGEAPEVLDVAPGDRVVEEPAPGSLPEGTGYVFLNGEYLITDVVEPPNTLVYSTVSQMTIGKLSQPRPWDEVFVDLENVNDQIVTATGRAAVIPYLATYPDSDQSIQRWEGIVFLPDNQSKGFIGDSRGEVLRESAEWISQQENPDAFLALK